MAKGRARPAGAPDGEQRPAGVPGESAEPTADDHPPAAPGESAEPSTPAPEPGGSGVVDEQPPVDVERERDEYLELAQRTRADFENYRKRVSSDIAEAERRGAAKLAAQLIPVLDNLERALRAAGVDPNQDGAVDGEGLAHGVLLVYRELDEALRRAGVERYDPLGEEFDPAWHEAVMTRSDEGTKSGVVVEVVDKGYRLDGQVLRPARVVVSK